MVTKPLQRLLLILPALSSILNAETPIGRVNIGPLTLTPSGFLESAGVFRSETTGDGESTRFGSIPLSSPSGESLLSFDHSRLMLDADTRIGAVSFKAYSESDFLNRPPQDPFRWRQYWARVEWNGWELLGGQGWSLLRPNRVGLTSRNQLMNTFAVDPAYHIGLVGYRNRQLRLAHHTGNWHAAVSFENGRDWLAKIAHDHKYLHWELTGVSGGQRHRGASVAAVIHAHPKLDVLAQQFWSKGGGRDALSVAPASAMVVSTLEGLEWNITDRWRIFGYGGLVHAGRTSGNRLVSEITAGFSHELIKPSRYGAAVFALQFSKLQRSLWTDLEGRMSMTMLSLRYYIGPR